MRRIAALLVLTLAACDSGDPGPPPTASTGVVMRSYQAVPQGSVPRGASAHALALAASPPVTPALISAGRERYAIFCMPCHGGSGRGDGPIVSRGFPAPPSLLDRGIQATSPEQIVEVITHGRGLMLPFAERIPPEERWAIAHFVKALQADGQPKEVRP